MFAVSGLLLSCNNKKAENTAGTSIDTTAAIIDETKSVVQEGDSIVTTFVYEGVLPCADCSGIKTVLKMHTGKGPDYTHRFELSSTYQGKNPEKEFVQKGNFNVERGFGDDPNGTIYVLDWDKPESEQVYYGFSGYTPDKIFLLDKNREIIKSKLIYSLTLKK